MAIARGEDILKCSPNHPASFRQYIKAVLYTRTYSATDHLIDCNVPGCTNQGTKTNICCVVCGRWAHRGCAYVERTLVHSYVCVICEAQYGN